MLVQPVDNWSPDAPAPLEEITLWQQRFTKRNIALKHAIASSASPQAKVVVACKQFSPAQLVAAINAGLTVLGENTAQALQQKKTWLKAQLSVQQYAAIEWHFIGRLQKNKVNKVVGEVSLLHSVESMALALAINARAKVLERQQGVLLQVNISKEPTKQGFMPNELEVVMPQLLQECPYLKVRGLMGMAALDALESQAEKSFSHLVQLCVTLSNKLEQGFMTELSMGMSQDFSAALCHQVTWLRLGSFWLEVPGEES